VAAEGRLPWSEVATICGTRLVPLSPYSPFKIRPLARLFDLPAELQDLLRYGRGVDTRRFASTGFTYNATSAGAVQTFIRALRLRRQSGNQPSSYTYEHDVEQFFRHSPYVVTGGDA
jgi:UDP-glucose 4-epimerase